MPPLACLGGAGAAPAPALENLVARGRWQGAAADRSDRGAALPPAGSAAAARALDFFP